MRSQVASGVPGSHSVEIIDYVADACGKAEDARRGHEDADAIEWWEHGCSQGSGTMTPARGSIELSKAAVRRDHSA